MDVRWLVGLGLATVLAVNAALFWYALKNPPDIVPSYATEAR